jgi:hypothetical protein
MGDDWEEIKHQTWFHAEFAENFKTQPPGAPQSLDTPIFHHEEHEGKQEEKRKLGFKHGCTG